MTSRTIDIVRIALLAAIVIAVCFLGYPPVLFWVFIIVSLVLELFRSDLDCCCIKCHRKLPEHDYEDVLCPKCRSYEVRGTAGQSLNVEPQPEKKTKFNPDDIGAFLDKVEEERRAPLKPNAGEGAAQ